MEYQIVQDNGEWFAIVTVHGREFTYGPFEAEREAQLEAINRETDRLESWYGD
jgi:hypothetical protein